MSQTYPPTSAPTSCSKPESPQEDIRLIGRALDIVGDAWTLLIVREALAGTTRFGQFQRHLGLGPNILAARLRALIEHGVLTTQASCQRADWSDYVLTEKGARLQTVLAALREWGGDHCVAAGDHGAPMREAQ
ncbi:winged helix-turn-helix transcriptional regulator [Cupriavidus pauculus]|nr:helix-turn-helix domain-containing protein [Cupriavidus pauculus]